MISNSDESSHRNLYSSRRHKLYSAKHHATPHEFCHRCQFLCNGKLSIAPIFIRDSGFHFHTTQLKMSAAQSLKALSCTRFLTYSICFVLLQFSVYAQNTQPAPSSPESVVPQNPAPATTTSSSPTPTPSPSPTPSASPTPAPRPAVVKLRVELETNGVKQSVGLKRFFLLRDDFEKPAATVGAAAPAVANQSAVPTRSAYYRSVGASPELLAWFDANKCDYVYCREMRPDDLRVPEFRKAYEQGQLKWRSPSIAMKWLTMNLPDSIRTGYLKRRTPVIDDVAMRARAVATVVTSEKGIALLTNVAPGEYYLSNILPFEIGGLCVLWNHKVTVPPGKTGKDTTFLLANDNSKSFPCVVPRAEQTPAPTAKP